MGDITETMGAPSAEALSQRRQIRTRDTVRRALGKYRESLCWELGKSLYPPLPQGLGGPAHPPLSGGREGANMRRRVTEEGGDRVMQISKEPTAVK